MFRCSKFELRLDCSLRLWSKMRNVACCFVSPPTGPCMLVQTLKDKPKLFLNRKALLMVLQFLLGHKVLVSKNNCSKLTC